MGLTFVVASFLIRISHFVPSPVPSIFLLIQICKTGTAGKYGEKCRF